MMKKQLRISMRKRIFPLAIILITPGLLVPAIAGAANTTPTTEQSPSTQEDVRQLLQSAQTAKYLERQTLLKNLANPDSKSKTALEPAYLQLLDDKDQDVRSAAAHACGVLQTTQAIPKLRLLLKAIPRHGPIIEAIAPQTGYDELNHAFPIAQALSELGDLESITEMTRRDSLASVWVMLMPKFGAAAIPSLADRARARIVNSEPVRLGAMRAIASIEDQSAIPALKLLLTDRDANVRYGAAKALGKMNAPDAAAAVEQAYDTLNDWGKIDFVQSGAARRDISVTMKYVKKTIDDPRVNGATKNQFVVALGMTKNPVVIPYLVELLKNHDDGVRVQAACELKGLTGKTYPYEQTNMTRLLDRGCVYTNNPLTPQK